jgi:hypothetical protein
MAVLVFSRLGVEIEDELGDEVLFALFGFLGGGDEAVGDAGHGGDDYNDGALGGGGADDGGSAGDARGVADGGAAEFHDLEGAGHCSGLIFAQARWIDGKAMCGA